MRSLTVINNDPALQLDDVRVASPCAMSWEDMTGGDRVRFCAACQKNVFNLSGMKRSDAQRLVADTDGKMCIRFYRRADGTVLTADCPVGIALLARKAKRAALSVAALSLGAVAALLALLAQAPLRKPQTEWLEVTTNELTVTKRTLEKRHSELVVPELATDAIAGGLRAFEPKMGDYAMPEPRPHVEDLERE